MLYNDVLFLISKVSTVYGHCQWYVHLVLMFKFIPPFETNEWSKAWIFKRFLFASFNASLDGST